MNKYIVTLFLGILFLTLPQQGAAQDNNRLTKETKVAMEKLGKALNTTDSAYIEPNHYNLTFMVEQSFGKKDTDWALSVPTVDKLYHSPPNQHQR